MTRSAAQLALFGRTRSTSKVGQSSEEKLPLRERMPNTRGKCHKSDNQRSRTPTDVSTSSHTDSEMEDSERTEVGEDAVDDEEDDEADDPGGFHASIQVGDDYQVRVLPDWSCEACVHERGDVLIPLETDMQVQEAKQVEKEAANAWAARHGGADSPVPFDRKADSEHARAASPAPSGSGTPSGSMGKRVRWTTPKAEALRASKSARQDGVRGSKGEAASSTTGEKDAKVGGCKGDRARGSKEGRHKAKAKCSQPARQDDGVTPAVRAKAGGATMSAAAGVATEMTAGTLDPQSLQAMQAAQATAKRERRRMRQEKVALDRMAAAQAQLDDNDEAAELPLCATLLSLDGGGASMACREQMLWNVIATPMMMRDFSRLVAAQQATARQAAAEQAAAAVQAAAQHQQAAQHQAAQHQQAGQDQDQVAQQVAVQQQQQAAQQQQLAAQQAAAQQAAAQQAAALLLLAAQQQQLAAAAAAQQLAQEDGLGQQVREQQGAWQQGPHVVMQQVGAIYDAMAVP